MQMRNGGIGVGTVSAALSSSLRRPKCARALRESKSKFYLVSVALCVMLLSLSLIPDNGSGEIYAAI